MEAKEEGLQTQLGLGPVRGPGKPGVEGGNPWFGEILWF